MYTCTEENILFACEPSKLGCKVIRTAHFTQIRDYYSSNIVICSSDEL